ncbi:LuxR C-terminal-related transcriptional regulator [Specibacter sp. NPDC057265]|uniref:LuxR C-terminal-related transcriptional regulator n=1 Tax=Specibacter sp. NPDC057265 TaxID=3346075 RepID=UPI00362D2691
MIGLGDGPALAAEQGAGQALLRRAMGAQDRRTWSSLMRQSSVDAILAQLQDNNFLGAAILGPRGVGKTSLARCIESKLAATSHVVRLYGTEGEPAVPYGALAVQMARLSARQSESPAAIIEGLSELVRQDAKGRPVVIVLDELPGIDTSSMGVIMHLLLTGTAKLMVMARQPGDLPEDLAWMMKDRLLRENRIEPFSREEVRVLLSKALGGTVGESVVTALFHSSSGNPLVLHALVTEYLGGNVLKSRAGIWILDGTATLNTDSILSELVTARMARENAVVNTGVEKMSLLRRVPLSAALSGLGAETLSQLEERGLVQISPRDRQMVSLTEPYVGEMVRARMGASRKAALLREISAVLSFDLNKMNPQERVAYAGWVIDAGMDLEPELALAAAQAAINLFEPVLALACCARIPAGHPLAVQAAQKRSRAHFITANHSKSVAALEVIDVTVLDGLSPAAYGSWLADSVSSLLWVPGGYYRIAQLLAEAQLRLKRAEAARLDTTAARRALNLARFEYMVHKGEFQQLGEDLEIGSKDGRDREYRLNCASLLIMVFAATGRESEAVELGKSIEVEVEKFDLVLRMSPWRQHGMVLALMWSGQWRACETMLQRNIETYSRLSQYRGGDLELGLGMAYTFAGRGSQARELLLTAAAQLEVRDSCNSLGLVYSALALASAQIHDDATAAKYLRMAQGTGTGAMWVHRSTAELFQLMARRWMGDKAASEQLVSSAIYDSRFGRFTTASISLFAATLAATDEHYRLLEESSLKRQGGLASINVAVARAQRTGNAALVLEAAAQAQLLELDEVECRCAVLALDLAHAAGDSKTAREARTRLDRLQRVLPVFPVLPSVPSVKLTARELQIARLAAQGLGNRAIASRIGVSVRTVEGHLYQVFAKLDVSSRDELKLAVEP